MADDEARSKMQAFLAEWHREWDALPWHAKMRRRLASWRGELFWKPPVYDDEPLAKFPSLAESAREWDALPRREKWRQRFDSSREYGLVNDLGEGWGRVAMVGVGLWVAFLFVAGPIVKLLVPGRSEWLRLHIGTVMLVCLAPLVLPLALWFVGGWLVLPFTLAHGLWRRVRH